MTARHTAAQFAARLADPVAALEADYEDTLVDAALKLGYLVHAERAARTARGHRTAIKGVAGWPDLVIVGRGRFLVVELKRKGNEPSTEQSRWLAELVAAGVDARLAYVPEQLDELLDWLKAGRA